MPGAPTLFHKRGYRGPAAEAYHGGSFVVYYGKQPEAAVFIEVPGCAGVRLVYDDLDIFESTLQSVLEAFHKRGAKETNESRIWFPDLQLMLILPVGDGHYHDWVWAVGLGEPPVYEPEP